MTFSKNRIYFKVQSRKIEKRGEKVFPNLEAEMARNKVTQVKLAEILGITPTTLSFKMNGKSTLSLKECVEIKRKAFPDKTLDYLFATDETGSEESIEQAVIDCFRKCWDNPRGFTIAPGCDIPVTASLENIDAYMRAARKCAKYPVQPSNWE